MPIESGLDSQVAKLLLDTVTRDQRLVLAFSGGLDSCVLLHLLKQLQSDRQLLVWHLHHGLQDCADEMANFAASQADKYQLEFKISHLALDRSGPNLESTARKARYREFERGMQDSDVLLTAHHADDQAETLFLNLLRGSGSTGLRGIARTRKLSNMTVLRPLLDFSRSALSEYANQHEIQWFEDPSNQDDRFDRNYLRNRVIPVIKDRWPGLLKALDRVSRIQSENRQILDEVAQIDYRSCGNEATRLNKNEITKLSTARQKNLIRYWLGMNQLAGLPAARMETLLEQLKAQHHAQPRIQGKGYDLRIYDNQLFIALPFDDAQLAPSYDFDNSEEIRIPCLNLHINRNDILNQLNLPDSDQTIQLVFRSENCPQKSEKHRLKRLFQKYRIPPWRRNHTPLIIINGELKDLLIPK